MDEGTKLSCAVDSVEVVFTRDQYAFVKVFRFVLSKFVNLGVLGPGSGQVGERLLQLGVDAIEFFGLCVCLDRIKYGRNLAIPRR